MVKTLTSTTENRVFPGGSSLTHPALVLNKHWQPIDSKPVQQVLCDVFAGEAQILGPDYQTFNMQDWLSLEVEDGQLSIGTVQGAMRVPEIVINHYDRIPKRRTRFSRANLWKRDAFHCFTPDSLVMMSDYGLKPISEIQVGDKIIDAFGKEQSVQYVYSKYVDEDLIKIRHRGNGDSLLCTHNHKLLLSNRQFAYKWRKASTATILDYMAELDIHKSYNSHFRKSIDLSEWEGRYLDKNDYTIWNKNGSHKINRYIESSCDLGRLVGYFLAEGSASKNKRSKNTTFCFHIDEEEFTQDVCNLLLRIFNVKSKVYCDSDHNTSIVICSSSIVTSFFANWCYVDGEKRINSKDHSAEYLAGILYGILRGDANFNHELHRTVLMLKNENLVRDIYIISQMVGMKPTLSKTGIRDDGRIYKSVVYNAGEYNKTLDVCEIEGERHTKESKIDRTFSEDKPFFLGKITKIESVPYKGLVYDLQISGTHTYIVNFVCVHNCQYCSCRPRDDELTIDHVIPKRLWTDEWHVLDTKMSFKMTSFGNCVLACLRCNKRKDGRSLRQSGMRLQKMVMDKAAGEFRMSTYKKPKVPRWSPIYSVRRKSIPKSWREWIEDMVDELYWNTELEP